MIDHMGSDNSSLKRIFTSSANNKYQMVSKLLAPQGGQSNVSPTTPAPPPAAPPQPTPSPNEPDLDLLDNLVEQAILNRQLVEPASQIQGTAPARAKEALANHSQDQADNSLEVSQSAPESGANSQEAITSPEIQELSKELKEVSKETNEQREQAMIKEKQQAINDLAAASAVPVAVTDQPVVVLPITAKSKEEAKFKTTAYSVKWLWEWCKKIGKMFAGAVVYKEEVEEA